MRATAKYSRDSKTLIVNFPDQWKSADIFDLSASKLTAGTITSQAITLAIAAGTGDVKIQAGKTDFGDNTAGFIIGMDDSDSDKPKFEIGNANSWLKWDGAMDIKLASGEVLTLSAGGDIILTGADADPALLTWNSTTDFHFGAYGTAARLALYPSAAGAGTLRFGYNLDFTRTSFLNIRFSAHDYLQLDAYGDADNQATIEVHADHTAPANQNYIFLSTLEGGVQTSMQLDAGLRTLYPFPAGVIDLGTDTYYWNDINYKTLDDRGCLGWFDDGVELQDGTIVSDLEGLRQIKMHPTKKTVFGLPMIDYRTFPKPIYRRAGLKNYKGWEYFRDKDDEPWAINPEGKTVKAEDGAELSSLVSFLLGTTRALDREVEALNAKIKLLEAA